VHRLLSLSFPLSISPFSEEKKKEKKGGKRKREQMKRLWTKKSISVVRHVFKPILLPFPRKGKRRKEKEKEGKRKEGESFSSLLFSPFHLQGGKKRKGKEGRRVGDPPPSASRRPSLQKKKEGKREKK